MPVGPGTPWRSFPKSRNPEGEGSKRSILPWVLGGAAVLLLMRGGGGSLLGGILGGSTTGAYTQVGTDASGRPIYSGPVGGVTPAGYTRTGTTAAGNPVYSYGGGGTGVLGMAPGLLTGVTSLVSSIGRMFSPGVAQAATVGVTQGAGVAAGDLSMAHDILGGSYYAPAEWVMPDISLPDFAILPDVGIPDLSMPLFDAGGFDLGSLADWQMPQLDLGLGTSLSEAWANLGTPSFDVGWF
jgi:hypothetical protein